MVRPYKTASRMSAWVAILAVALNALWPLIAECKPGAPSSLVEACDEAGMHHAAGDPDSAPSDSVPLMPHCAFCSLAAGGFAVLTAKAFDAAFLRVEADEFRPAPVRVWPPAFAGYSPARPRAPPVLS